MVSNPNYFSTSSNASPLNQIKDAVDFPHSGLIKALNGAMSDRSIISGCDITISNSSAQGSTGNNFVTVTAGIGIIEGKRCGVTGNAQTIAIAPPINSFHLVVAPKPSSSGSTQILLRTSTTTNTIPDLTAGDTIVAVIKYLGGSTAPEIQYLTADKKTSSLSIARENNNNEYTEGLTIQSNAGNIEIEAKEADKDIIFKVKDGNTAGAEVMRINASEKRVGIGTASPTTKLEVKGDGTLARTGDTGITTTLTIEGARFATGAAFAQIDLKNYDSNSGPTSYVGARISALNEADGVNDGSLVFSTNDANAGITERMRIKDSGKVGIGTTTPANAFQVSHTGTDGKNGIMIVREDTTTITGNLLGGVGFDSTDGNVPSSVLESSAFIAAFSAESHGLFDKGGNLKFGVSMIDEDDDTVSTIVASVGQPDTIANATTHAGLNSRATTAVVGAATYAPTIGDSGTLVIFTNASSNLTLPSINNATSVGVQFTVFNETSSAINGQIAVSNSATINGGAASALDDIESFKAATFVCSGNNTWIRIG
jgi:hypothetical protein